MADGSIRIETKLDNTAVKQQIRELERELKNIQKEQAKTEAQASQVRSKYDSEREFDAQFPEEFSHREEIDKRAAAELDPIIQKQDELNAKKQHYLTLLDQANAKLREQSAFTTAGKELGGEVKKILGGSADIQSQAQYNSLLEETKSKMDLIETSAEKIAAANGVSKEALLASNKDYQKLHGTFTELSEGEYDFQELAVKGIALVGKEAIESAAALESLKTPLSNLIKNVGKMGTALFGVRGAYRAIRVAATEYLATNKKLEGQINTLKTLWGQVLGPVIEYVVNLLIKAVSVVNSFIYALTGINLVAKANEAALKKQSKAATDAQGASFDEQNKVSSTSSSSIYTLSDGTSLDLSFLDPLKEALQNFWNDISPLIETIKSTFKWLWDNVLVPFADWVANSLIPAFLEVVGELCLVLNDALIRIKPILLWIWENILAPIAQWVGDNLIEFLRFVGEWISEHHETLSKILSVVLLIVLAIEAVNVVLPLLSGALDLLTNPLTWIIIAVVAVIAIFTELYDSCEEFRIAFNDAWTAIKDIAQGVVDFFKALFTGDWTGLAEAWAKIRAAADNLWKGVWEGLCSGWAWIRTMLDALFAKLVLAFCDFFGISRSSSEAFAGFGKNMMDGLGNGIKNSISKVTQACKEIWNTIKGVFASVGTWFKDTFSNAWQKVKDIFSSGGKIFDGIKEGISSTFKTIVNGLIDGINKIIKTPFNSINSMLNTIRGISVLGVTPFKGLWSYNPLSIPQIPKLALGGIVNRPGRGVPAIIGEAGAEAVLPLENNTEWMDILADKIGGGTVTIPITLDGKRIATYIVDIQKKKAFAMNGA